MQSWTSTKRHRSAPTKCFFLTTFRPNILDRSLATTTVSMTRGNDMSKNSTIGVSASTPITEPFSDARRAMKASPTRSGGNKPPIFLIILSALGLCLGSMLLTMLVSAQDGHRHRKSTPCCFLLAASVLERLS